MRTYLFFLLLIPSASAAFAAPPDIVLISVDTLRADRLGCYGSTRGLTPNIDKLATNAMIFEDVICETPQTGPSLTSMFTSQFPRMTGVIRNSVPLGTAVPTAPGLLRASGYQTMAVVSNWNLKRKLCGLEPGFEVYDDDFSRGNRGSYHFERDAEEVTDAALALLAKRDPQRPMFLWVHYMDPHYPYEMHGEHGPGVEALRAMNPTERARARYDSEVAYCDTHIGRLLSAINPDEQFVVFTADHGESLNEHGYVGHTRRLYQQMLHIPLIISGPKRPAGRSKAPARGIDVGTTLLAVAGVVPAPEMLGVDLMQSPPPLERLRVVELYGGDIPTTEKGRAELATRPPKLQAVLRGPLKLIVGKRRERYRLDEDPGELKNRKRDEDSTWAPLEHALKEWSEKTPRSAGAGIALSPEDIEALRATGYL